MCRNITELRGLEPPATAVEIEAAARQYVRKVSGITRPGEAGAAAFEKAVAEVAADSRVPGLSVVQAVEANVVFVRMPAEVAARTRQRFAFADWPLQPNVVRLMCAFDTTPEDVDALVSAIVGE